MDRTTNKRGGAGLRPAPRPSTLEVPQDARSDYRAPASAPSATRAAPSSTSATDPAVPLGSGRRTPTRRRRCARIIAVPDASSSRTRSAARSRVLSAAHRAGRRRRGATVDDPRASGRATPSGAATQAHRRRVRLRPAAGRRRSGRPSTRRRSARRSPPSRKPSNGAASTSGSPRAGQLRAPSRITLGGDGIHLARNGKAGEILNRSGERYKPSALRTIEQDFRLRLIPDLGAHFMSDIERAGPAASRRRVARDRD